MRTFLSQVHDNGCSHSVGITNFWNLNVVMINYEQQFLGDYCILGASVSDIMKAAEL